METRFQFQDFLKVFSLALLLLGVFIGLVSWVPSADQIVESLPKTVSFTIKYLIQFVVLFFPLWVFVVNKYETTWEDFGLKKVSLKSVLGTAITCYIIYIVFMGGLAWLLDLLQIMLPGNEQQESYLPIFGSDLMGFIIGGIFIALVAPFLEEILFRGFVYPIFRKTWTPWLGSLLTALVFALAHAQFQNFFPLLLLGLFLGYCYRKTGSLWTSIAFHSLNNTIAFGVDVYLTTHPTLLEEWAAFLYNIKI